MALSLFYTASGDGPHTLLHKSCLSINIQLLDNKKETLFFFFFKEIVLLYSIALVTSEIFYEVTERSHLLERTPVAT